VSWQSSESVSAISSAMVRAMGSMTEVSKNKEANIPTKGGSQYRYSYADLGNVLSHIRPILANNALAVTQTASNPDHDSVAITTTLIHESGEWMRFEPLVLPSGRTAQETGSAITYARRYALLAIFGLATEDDDGASSGTRRNPALTAISPVSPIRKQAVRNDTATDTLSKELAEMLAGVSSETARSIKAAFMAKYVKVSDLDGEKISEAKDWIALQIALSDVADKEWTESATKQEES